MGEGQIRQAAQMYALAAEMENKYTPEIEDIKKYPYLVYHEEAIGPPPVFATWKEALTAQREWNKEVPGHKAMKRKSV